MNIAVIPARGGSKRISRKNIKSFCGRPLISWPIQIALKSKLFDRVILSSEDEEIISIAKKYGAEVPFLRPKELSDDFSTTDDVMKHAANWIKNNEYSVNTICCIYATAPFLNIEDLKIGLKKFNEGNFNYVFAATDYSAPIFRSFEYSEKKGLRMFFPENYNKRSQDLPVAYHDAGQFYWGSLDTWVKKKETFNKYSYPIILPRWRVQDIDTIEDWERAELIMKTLDLSPNN
tara:strand:+ start:121 stop:819 length:699 start_codon:yes stop_codon:yes gene_type:complete